MRLFLGGLGCRVVSGHGEVRVEFQSDSLIFRLHGRRAAAASGLGECLVIAHLGCGTPMEKVQLWLLLGGVLFGFDVLWLTVVLLALSERRRRASLTPSRPMLAGSCTFGVLGQLHLSGFGA